MAAASALVGWGEKCGSLAFLLWLCTSPVFLFRWQALRLLFTCYGVLCFCCVPVCLCVCPCWVGEREACTMSTTACAGTGLLDCFVWIVRLLCVDCSSAWCGLLVRFVWIARVLCVRCRGRGCRLSSVPASIDMRACEPTRCRLRTDMRHDEAPWQCRPVHAP